MLCIVIYLKKGKHRGKAKKRRRSKNRGYFRGKQSSYRREISKRKKALELGRVFEADPIGVPTSPEIPPIPPPIATDVHSSQGCKFIIYGPIYAVIICSALLCANLYVHTFSRYLFYSRFSIILGVNTVKIRLQQN